MRYFVHLSYDGGQYHGWQVQPNGESVQEVLQRCLSTLLRQETRVTGAGRTDMGVHALRMVAHFDVGEGAQTLDCGQLAYRLNKMLPRDIAVSLVERVRDDMHARFSALSRTYHYYVTTRKMPLRRNYSWQVYGEVDFGKMNDAAKILLGTRDFTSFSKVDTDTKTNICTVTEARWQEVETGVWRFTMTANRFLRNMVRATVGTLVEVGRGKMTPAQFAEVMEKKDRCEAGESVPGHALFLADIKYTL